MLIKSLSVGEIFVPLHRELKHNKNIVTNDQ